MKCGDVGSSTLSHRQTQMDYLSVLSISTDSQTNLCHKAARLITVLSPIYARLLAVELTSHYLRH